jgi:hypothetical protein
MPRIAAAELFLLFAIAFLPQCGRHVVIVSRAAFVHPSRNLQPKTFGSRERFDRFATSISCIQNSVSAFSARQTILYARLICHESPLHLLVAICSFGRQ